MRLYRGNRLAYIRHILWSEREVFWPHLLVHDCAIHRIVRDLCPAAGWEWEVYRTAVAFDAPWLLEGAGE